MEFDDYILCIRSSFKAPSLLAWKANLDIQIVLEPYGCAS